MAERTVFPESLTNGPQRNGPQHNGTERPYHPSKSVAAREEISLHDIIEIIFKNKWIILSCFVVILGLAAFYTLRQAPEYEAKSTVYINTQQSNAQLGELLGLENFNRNIANEIEIVKSRKIAMRVAEQLVDIERVPGTDQRLTMLGEEVDDPEEYTLNVAQHLQRHISVQPVSRGVDIIELVVTSTIPKEAALVSTLWAEEYVENNRTTSRARMTASREFLKEVTDQFSIELQGAENDLTAFFNRERLVAPDEEAKQLIEQVSTLQQQQYQTHLELGSTQTEIRALETEIEAVMPGLANQITSGDNLVIEQLVQEIARLEVQIEKKYARTPRLRQDPAEDASLMQDLREVEALRDQLNERSEQLLNGNSAFLQSGGSMRGSGQNAFSTLNELRKQLVEKKIRARAVEARAALVEEQLEQAGAQLGDIPRKEVILSRLQRSRETTERLYVTLIEKLQEAEIAEKSELGYVEIVDEAIIPREPVRPRVRFNLIVGAVFGLVIGLALAFGRNAVDSKVRKPEDLRKRGYNVLGLVPNMERVIRQDFKGKERVAVEGNEYDTRMISLLNPLSPVAEGYRRLRTNIQFSRPDANVQMIMITSPGPGDGKTVTAINLAVTMAQAGRRTLYIDADLRRPQGHRMIGVPREAGLVDLLFDALPDSIEQFATSIDSYLYVIPAGRDVPNPAEVLGSRKMKNFLARWRKEFDVIVIDTPPTLLVADALILASTCDTTLVVCAAGMTSWQAVDQCSDALRSVGADVIGVLLNRYDPKAAYGGYKYGYGYEYGYGSYYYYGQSKNPKRRGRLARNA